MALRRGPLSLVSDTNYNALGLIIERLTRAGWDDERVIVGMTRDEAAPRWGRDEEQRLLNSVLVEVAPEHYRIAMATLDLVSEAASDAPVLLVVDDAQWLDRPTSDVLAFVAR